MNLIIVESPTKARTLTKFLSSDYRIEASYGHIRDLPKSDLGIDVEHDFTPRYVIPTKVRKRVNELVEISQKAKKIILATDPDREGEAIAWHVQYIIQNPKSKIRNPKIDAKNIENKFSRMVFHEITKEAIEEALKNPREIDMNLVNAQQARRILDRLVGYKLSPLLWAKIRRGLSAGRVQSVCVRLIVEREREILAFKSEAYWEIETWLEKQITDNSQHLTNEFKAKLTQINGIKAEIKSQEEADRIKNELTGAEYLVKTFETKNINRNPYPPFSTSTMTQAAANLFYWPAKKTMTIAQQLFEEGYITYHRTDSFNLANDAINQVRDFVKTNYGEDYLPLEARAYKTKSKVAQEAHEAIRPTYIKGLNEYETRIKEGIGRDAWMLYQLIAKRTISCQMKEAVYERTAADISANNKYTLRANGSKQLFDGWLKVFGKEEDEDTEKQILPALVVDEKLKLREVEPIVSLAKQTEPPARFNEASLIKTLEEFGIGRPSTYAPTISTIIDRMYVEKVERRFQPTSLGFAVNDFLMKYFPEILDYKFTATMEDNLDKIANGEIQWQPLIKEFYTPFEQKLTAVQDNAEKVEIEVEKTDEKCPQCGADLVVRLGKFGKFLACTKFPECKFTKPYTAKTNFKCPQCGGDIIIRQTKFRKKFYGCSNYPNCKYASWKKPEIAPTEEKK